MDVIKKKSDLKINEEAAGTYSRNSVMYLRLHLDQDQGLVS